MQQNPTDIARQLLAIESLLGLAEFIPAERNPLPPIDLPQPTPPRAAERLSPGRKASVLRELDEQEVQCCKKCPLSKTRTHTVFGEVNPDADLVFVGEAPGADEDATGRPFVGRAGELLTTMIHAMGLSRDAVFICNTIKCRPPDNRPPSPEETNACWGYLVRQLQIIQPRVIVTLGNPATKGLLMTKVGITKLRGNWQQLPEIGPGLAGIAVMPTFHPAYVLRNYSPETRGRVWSDLQSVMQYLGLPLPK
jgi:DNA polymerase